MMSVKELLSSSIQGHEGQCLVCYSDLEYPAITPCGHNEVCATCHLRLRFLHEDKKCPMCKSLNPQLIVDSSQDQKLFEEYPLWGNELGQDFVYRQDVGMFFPSLYYHMQIEPLFGFQCLACNEYDGTTPDENVYEQGSQQTKRKTPTPLRALQDHLRNKHRLALCQLCVDHKRDFVSQLPRFTPNQLKHHLQKGDGQGSRGHPLCEFCRPKRFYDLAALHEHLARDHYKCHVCDKQDMPNQYFRNYDSLEKHFQRQHFLCPDPQCRAARFVVFENELDLKGHEISTHGTTSSGSTKIQLEFRYRRANEQAEIQQDVPSAQDFQYGLDGQAFVPDELPDQINTEGAPNEDISHPLHLTRTNELRAHAAQIRRERQMQDMTEAFPSLQGESTSMSATDKLRVGWSQGASARLGRTNQMAPENFPSLPTSSGSGNNKKNNSVSAKLKSGGMASSNRQFAAIRSAAEAAPSSGWIGGASSVVAAPPVSTASFPSLTRSTAQATARSSINRQSDLTQENFPSLAGTTTAPRYTAAENLARKKSAAPFITRAADFPPPPSAKPAPSFVRQQVLGANKKPPAVDNVLEFPPPPSSKEVTVEEIKATLGSVKYKQLRKLTKEFAADSMAPDAYVDHAASLFDQGYADRDFWAFIPTLLGSCPNTSSANKAQRYMEDLRRNQTSLASTASSTATSSRSNGGWTSTPNVAAVPRASVASISSWSSSSTQARPAPPTKRPGSNAWSGGPSSTVARAKQRPGSVAVAAAQQGSEKSTATKFMANEAKQSKKQETKKTKKKQNEELRALAFGGK